MAKLDWDFGAIYREPRALKAEKERTYEGRKAWARHLMAMFGEGNRLRLQMRRMPSGARQVRMFASVNGEVRNVTGNLALVLERKTTKAGWISFAGHGYNPADDIAWSLKDLAGLPECPRYDIESV